MQIVYQWQQVKMTKMINFWTELLSAMKIGFHLRTLSGGGKCLTNKTYRNRIEKRVSMEGIYVIIHQELLNRNETVTSDLYVHQLKRVQNQLQEKRSALVNSTNVYLVAIQRK